MANGEDKVSKIYNLYKSKGLINKTDLSTFASASREQQEKIYNLGKKNNLINEVTPEQFYSAWGEPDVKKKEQPKPTESPSVSDVGDSSLGQQQPPSEDTDTTPLISKMPKIKQEAFSSYLQQAISTGDISQKEVEESLNEGKPSGIFDKIAQNKVKGTQVEDKPLSFEEEPTVGESTWGPRFFAQGARGDLSVEKDKENYRRSIIEQENNKFSGEVKQRILKEIPENEKTPAKLEEIEEDILQTSGMRLNLNEDNIVGRDKGIVSDVGISLQRSVENIGLTTATLLQEGIDALTGRKLPFNIQAADAIAKYRDGELERLSRKITQYEGDILDNIKDGNIGDALRISAQQTAESAPLMAVAALSGNPVAGWAAISTVAGAEHYLDVRDEPWFNELSDGAKIAYSVAYGGAEGFGEMIGGRVLKRSVLNLASKQGAKEQSKKVVKDFLMEQGKLLGLNISEESAAEGVTGVTQYVSDALAKGEDITMEGVEDAFLRSAVSGVGMAAVMTTPSTVIKAGMLGVNSVPFKKANKKAKELKKEIEESENQAEADLLKEELSEVEAEKRNIVKEQVELTDKMSEEDLDEYARAIIDLKKAEKTFNELPENSKLKERALQKADVARDKANSITDKYKAEEEVDSEQEAPQEQVTETQEDTDAIQERETTEVPSEPEAESIQEVETEVRGEQEGQEQTQESEVQEEGGVKSPTAQKLLGKTPSKTQKKVDMTDRQVVRQRIGDMVSAARDGYRQGVKEVSEFGNRVKDIIKEAPDKILTAAQSSSIAKRAATVKTERQLEKFNDYFNKVIERATYVQDIKTANQKRKQARRKYKSGNLGADNGNIKRALRLKPEDVPLDELDRYMRFVERLSSPQYKQGEQRNIDDARAFSDLFNSMDDGSPSKTDKPVDRDVEKEFLVSLIESEKRTSNENYNEALKEELSVFESLSKGEMEGMTKGQLQEVLNAIESIKEGFGISAKAAALARDIVQQRNKKDIKESLEDAKFNTLLRDLLLKPFRLLTGKFDNGKNLTNYLRNIPLNKIDTAIKGFKNDALYKKLVQPISVAFSRYDGATRAFNNGVKKLYDKIKDKKKADVRLALIGIAKQKESNPDASELSSVEDYMAAIIEDGERDNSYKKQAELYKEVYDEMAPTGELNWQTAYDNLTNAEKNLFDYVENNFAKQTDLVSASAARNGQPTIVYDFYNPINVRFFDKSNISEIEQDAKNFSKADGTVGKSPNLKERRRGAHPIELQFVENAKRATSSVLRDYYLRNPLRNFSGTINKLKADKDVRGDQLDFVNALDNVMNEVTRNIFVNTYFEGGFMSKLGNFLKKRGYQADLASIPRAGVEFASNFSHALTYSPREFARGIGLMTQKGGFENLSEIARLAETSQFSRLFQSQGGLMQEQGSMAQEAFTKVGDAIDYVNDSLVSMPDVSIARPIWLGTFFREFKNQTGQNLDTERFINDKVYRDQFKYAIAKSRDAADNNLVQGFATLNPFEGITASMVSKDENIGKTFDKYMTRFMRFEYQSMVDGYYGMIGRGNMSKEKGVQLMAATLIRMTAYQVLMFKAQSMIYSSFEMAISAVTGADIGPREEEDDDDIIKEIGRGALGSALTLLVMRRLGNIGRTPLALSMEYLNREYGEDIGLRDGEYDFDNNIVFSPFSRVLDNDGYFNTSKEILNAAANMTGPYNKITKNLIKGVESASKGGIENPLKEGKYLIEPSLKTKEAIERRQKEFYKRVLPEFIVLTAGAPAPRDVRNLLLREAYEDYVENNKIDKRKSSSSNRPSKAR